MDANFWIGWIFLFMTVIGLFICLMIPFSDMSTDDLRARRRVEVRNMLIIVAVFGLIALLSYFQLMLHLIGIIVLLGFLALVFLALSRWAKLFFFTPTNNGQVEERTYED